MPKKVSRNTCCFHHIAVFANDKIYGSSVYHFEHVIKQLFLSALSTAGFALHYESMFIM